MAAALSSEHFDNLQLRLKAPSKDAVRDICVESHRATNRRLEDDGGDNERFHCSGCLATPLPPAPLSPCSHGFCRADPPSVPRLLPLQPEESHHQDPAGEQSDVEDGSSPRSKWRTHVRRRASSRFPR